MVAVSWFPRQLSHARKLYTQFLKHLLTPFKALLYLGVTKTLQMVIVALKMSWKQNYVIINVQLWRKPF